MPMKYLILLTENGETPIIFPDFMYHDQVEEAMEHDGVIAAGFIKADADRLTCFGISESLGIVSRGEDDEIVIHHQLLTKAGD